MINVKRIILIAGTTILANLLVMNVFGAVNWRQVNDVWYYYNGETAQTGWILDGKAKYYLGTDGVMKTGWQKIDGSWYLFRSDGAMHTGWWNENGVWYYLKLDGTMLVNATGPDGHWMNRDGTWNKDIVDPQAARLAERGEGLKFILNWDTDSMDGLIGSGTLDNSIVCVLLNKYPEHILVEKEKEVYNVIKNFINTQIIDIDTDYDKVVKITKFIWEEGSYSNEDNATSGGPFGILIKGKGVCESYARTFKIMANAVGLECYVVGSGSHAWNIVCVDGEWYNADTTESVNGFKADDAKYVLRCDAEYVLSKYKTTKSPDCTATTYTKSTIKTN